MNSQEIETLIKEVETIGNKLDGNMAPSAVAFRNHLAAAFQHLVLLQREARLAEESKEKEPTPEQ